MKHIKALLALSMTLAIVCVGCAKQDACDAALSAWQQADRAKFRDFPETDYTEAASSLRALENSLGAAASIDPVNGALPSLMEDVGRVAEMAADFEKAITSGDGDSLEFYAHAYTNAIRGADSGAKELARQCH